MTIVLNQSGRRPRVRVLVADVFDAQDGLDVKIAFTLVMANGLFMGYMKLERAVGKNEKLESLKLESFAEVEKSQAKLERTD